jgi:cytochrome b6-f complex iron-sulfur subunit
MDRRTFLQTSAAGGALITIGVAPAGCGNDVEPAPLAKVVTNATPDVPPAIKQATLFDSALLDSGTYGTVQLLVEFYPQLVPVGGAITLELGKEITATTTRGYSVPIDNTILVVHQNDDPTVDNFLALQSSCPHAACPLGYNPKAKLVECPCHSSRFFADKADQQCIGKVAFKPANADLQRWKVAAQTSTTGTLLVIDLKTTLPCDCSTLPPVVKSADGKSLILTLPAADFPELATPGGSVCGQPSGLSNPIIVARLDGGTVIAVDSKCTHLGCTVAWDGVNRQFECPCHGSTFATDGRATLGPATLPLSPYSVEDMGTAVVVTIPVA